MALYLKRLETVVSLTQLEEPATSDSSIVALGPEAPVVNIGGARIAKYYFASKATPKVPRIHSVGDFARVAESDEDTRYRLGTVQQLSTGNAATHCFHMAAHCHHATWHAWSATLLLLLYRVFNSLGMQQGRKDVVLHCISLHFYANQL